MFNPHDNKTADGVVITVGLIVFDNDIAVGEVMSDRDASPYNCCSVRDNKLDGQHHESAQVRVNGMWFSDHHKGNAAVEQGCGCHHDHWFEVAYPDGGIKSMNGERLATRFQGKAATQEWAEAFN